MAIHVVYLVLGFLAGMAAIGALYLVQEQREAGKAARGPWNGAPSWDPVAGSERWNWTASDTAER
jgi:hypothetical protein